MLTAQVYQLFERIKESGKPARIFHLSDFDQRGDDMAKAVARKLEYMQHQFNTKLDIKLKEVALTKEQVEQYKLPRAPTTAKSKSYLGDWNEKNGEGMVELNALEVLHPGELLKILASETSKYYDAEIYDAAMDVCDDIREQIKDSALTQLQDSGIEDYFDRYNALVDKREEIKIPFLNEIGKLVEQIKTIESYMDEATAEVDRQIAAKKTEIDDSLPELDFSNIEVEVPESKLNVKETDRDWLYDSSRDYLTQLKYYKGVA